MKKGKILLSLSILAALGSFSAPLSWAADVTNPAKKVNTTVEGNVSAGVAENEGDNAVSNILTLDTGADISGNATGGVAIEGAGNALTNTVDVLDTAKVAGAVTGGVSYDGNAKENVVNMAGGTVIRGVTGGRTLGTGEAALNQVTIYGAAIGEETEQFGAVFGGVSAKGMANNNVVKIVGSTTTYENVMGGFSTGASANGNKVTLSGTNSIGTNIYGGDGQTGASNNELILEDNSTIGVESNTEIGYAAGGYTHTGDVLSNKLTVEGGTMNYAIGGYTETGGNAESNELTITSGTVYVEAAGGTTLGTGNASGNQATVSNATIGTETQAGTVYGGHAAKGSADNNVVKLTDTTTYGNVMGGLSDESSASGNKVTLSGTNTIKTNVSGGDGETGASNNELILEGNSTIGTQGNKDNGYATGGNTTTGTALSNKLTVEGGTMNYAIGGYADRDGSRVEGNTLTITGGTVYQEAAGGMIDGELEYKENGGTLVKTEGAVKNIVKMSGGQVRFLRGGAVTQYAAGDVIANEVYVSGDAQIDVGILGGSTYYGNAYNNIVEMTGGTVGMSVVGAYSILEGDAVGNHVTISNAVIGKEGGEDDSGVVTGAEARKGSAYNNVVELTDTTTYDNVVGGNSWEASASGNKVTILGTSSIGTNVFGGAGKTDAAENTVIIGGSTQIGGAVVGAQAEAGDAERNTVFIQGGTIAEEVTGGDAFGGNANDNAVIVTGGTINGDIIGGISNPDTTSGNTIIIAGGTINRSVIGGYGVADGSIIGNTVDILGGTFGENASLYGGLFIGSDYGTIEGNTLNFAAEGITVKNLANFQNINFYIDKETGSTPALLTVTNVSYISEASVHTFAENTEEIKAGGAITLLSAPKGIQAESTEINGTIIDSNYLSRHTSIENDGNNLILNVSDDDELFLNPDTKLFAETRAAGLALIGNGSDAAAVQGFEAAKAAYGEETGGFAPYASIGGFNLRHETGSYVDTNGMAANLGFARQYERDGYVDTLMPFFEYGRSDYTSHLDDGARGDGDQHYTGGGILYRRDRDDGLHYEAMIRAGRLSGDFKGNIDGIHASYDSDASYIAAEAGLGKIVSRENTSLDYYGKFFYTRLGSDSTVIHNSQEDNSYDFDSINSYRTRLGVRWTKEINKKESCYAGIGWDYEFDSDARASWRNFNTPTPTMEGSSGFLELGWKSKMTKDNPWAADFNLTGWAEKQRGITYTLGVSRAF